MTVRTEKKYSFNQVDKNSVRDWLLGSALGFKEVFFKREVNSLYFDSHDYFCYEENLSGVSKRSKARLRWYNDIDPLLSKATFEMKVKSNHLGNKLSHQFKFEDLDCTSSGHSLITQLRNLLPIEILPYFDAFSEPSLLVNYQREYYEDMQKKVRVTLDDEIIFSRPGYENLFSMDNNQKVAMSHGVLEVKIENASEAEWKKTFFSNYLIRGGRHSKYAIGITATSS
ncbi:VTC domain-containing protein [Pseudomonadales bacterium]|nr:VTC domain-containing protein [Pseudomonadales bacterium]